MCGFCVNCVKDGGEQKVVLNSCAMLCPGGVRVPSTIVTLNQGYLSTFQPSITTTVSPLVTVGFRIFLGLK